MSTPNVFVNLSFPNSGVGAASDVSALSANKTLVAQGPFDGKVVVEGSQDGGVTFTALTQVILPVGEASQIDIVAVLTHMRLRRVGGSGGSGVFAIGGVLNEDNQFSSLSLNSTAVDTSAFGPIKTYMAGGVFGGLLVFEGSQDGSSWDVIVGLANGQFLTLPGSYKNIRVRTVGDVGTAAPTIGASIDTSGSGSGAIVADWDLTLVRYYAVDPVFGIDTNKGYVDAAPGTVFATGVIAAVALKTDAERARRMPRYGNGRMVKVLYAPGNYGAVQQDVRGYVGYSYIFFNCSDFTNNLLDRVNFAGINDPTALGPNPDSSWTSNGAQVGYVITIAGVTPLPAQDVLAGLKVKYKGNATPSLANSGNMAIKRTGATTFEPAAGSALLALANNDDFWFQSPAAIFQSPLFDGTGVNGPEIASYEGITVAGFRYTNAIAPAAGSIECPINFVFCRFDGQASMQTRTMSYRFQLNYIDETLVARNVFCGVDFRGVAILSLGIGSAISACCFHAATNIIYTPNTNGGLLNACYSLLRPDVQQCATGPYINSAPGFGTQLPAVFHASVLVAGIRFLGGSAYGIFSIDTDGAANGITVVGDGATITVGTPTAGSGPLGTCTTSALDLSAARGASVIIENTTATGTVQDILMQGGLAKSFASLAADAWTDSQWNAVMGSGGNTVRRVTAGTFANIPILGADPGAPTDGDVWITNIAGARNICARIAGFTYRSLLT